MKGNWFLNKNIYVTQPLLPNLENLEKELSEIWESKIVTNAGVKHNLLEEKLKEHLGVLNWNPKTRQSKKKSVLGF